MTSEAELRARYQTSRFRETGRQVSPTEADEGSAEPPQAPIADTAEPTISGEEESRGLMADQRSDAVEEDQAAANTVTEPLRADEEDPAITSQDNEPIRVDVQPGSMADTQSDDSPALHRLSLADESLGNPADLALPASQPSTPGVPSSTPSLSNQEGIESQTLTYDDSGAGLPSSPRSPVEPNISTLPLNQSGDIPAQSLMPAETEIVETRDTEDDIGHLVSAENVETGQLDGATCSTRHHRHMQGSDSDSDQGRALTSQRDERDDTVAGTAATGGNEDTVNTAGPPRWQPDAEVTYCPICRTQFSFFIRKHHCRQVFLTSGGRS